MHLQKLGDLIIPTLYRIPWGWMVKRISKGEVVFQQGAKPEFGGPC
jgi:hypothetical protein